MESISHFRTIEELVKALDRERVLFRDMFERRKTMAYRTDYALELVDYKRERIQFLIDYGMIHENGDFVELEDVYIQFFEEVLDVNEEINISNVSEYIAALKENINYFLEETNEHRKYQYQSNVRKMLRRIGLRTLKNVVDLKRGVDTAYKQEPNYKIKMSRLHNLDEKRKGIKSLMKECEKLMETEKLFFSVAADPTMQRVCMDVHNDFTEADHSLMEIERQIIEYINQIEQQNALFKKIRLLKYFKDQLTWREDTNVAQVFGGINPLWMENRPKNRLFLSLEMLRTSDEAYTIIRKLGAKNLSRRLSRTEADPIEGEFFDNTAEEIQTVNTAELWNAFRAQGADLFSFIQHFDHRNPLTLNQQVILFCQMATLHSDELRFSDQYQRCENIEYALIYAK